MNTYLDKNHSHIKTIIISFMVIIALVMSMLPVDATYAASNEVCTSISGNSTKSTTFKVKVTPKTYGSDYIVLKHNSEGKYVYEYKVLGYWSGNEKLKKSYGYYTVKVKDPNGKVIQTLNWEDSKSLKIKFGSWFKYKASQFQTKTYTVTVTPYSKTAMRRSAHYGYTGEWYPKCTWKVHKTRGVGTCTYK